MASNEEKFGEAFGLPCPTCGGRMGVTDSRPSSMVGRGNRYADAPIVAVRRRRTCSACGYRMTTYEVPAAMIDKVTPEQHAKIVRMEECLSVAAEILTSLRKPEVTITDAEFEEIQE